MSVLLVLAYALREGVSRADYERWVREQDAPYVRSRPTVAGFEVLRVDGALEGVPPMDYVEIVEITDAEADAALLAQPPGSELDAAWRAMTHRATILQVTRIAGSEPPPPDHLEADRGAHGHDADS